MSWLIVLAAQGLVILAILALSLATKAGRAEPTTGIQAATYAPTRHGLLATTRSAIR